LGSFSWAALDTYKTSLKTIAAVEPSNSMRKLGKYMTKNLTPEILWVDALSMIPGLGGERGKFDLVLIGNVLSEIPTPNARELILNTLLERTKENGHLVIVEPGTPKGF